MSKHQIAIIGVSCLFPGATTPDEFWQNLIQGKNTTATTTEEHFGVETAVFYDAQRGHHDTTYFLRGGYIQNFQAYGLPKSLDNVFQWSLYVAREALKDSGYLEQREILTRTGLFLGNLSFPTRLSHQLVAPIYSEPLEEAISALIGANIIFPSRNTGEIDLRNALISGQPSALVAGMLGLGAATFALDAACASSLYAVGLACEYLAAGKADLMLAGAVSAADPLFINMGFTHFGAYPAEGDSRPLDSSSGGLVSGEGAGMFVLKRYADAVRDGDQIYAIVNGVGLSNDGRGKHFLTPNPRGQILSFQRAYADADIDPAAVQYVECHASGTPLGDKTEINSLDDFFGGRGNTPLLGAVKANLGHLLTSAGMASMLKVVMSMRHGMIPGTVGVESPLISQNRTFGADHIVSRNTPWDSEQKVAGVNAFGFGGVNAHAVISQGLSTEAATANPAPTPRLAIVGMDAHFGEMEGLDDFAQALYEGRQHFKPLPPKRWKGLHDKEAPEGAYIESFEIDFLRFKFPPKEDEQPIAQQLLLLKVADKALRDAGMHEGGNVAVIVALGTELSLHQYLGRLDLSWQIRQSLLNAGVELHPQQLTDLQNLTKDAINPPAQVNQYTSAIGNIVSSRVSAHWNFSGPAFTLSSEENSTFKALEVAQMLLADDALDAVVVGAVDLAGGVESVLLRSEMHPLNSNAPTLSFDLKSNGWTVGEGAGAVVLKRADRTRHNERVYAYLDALAFSKEVVQAAQAALEAAGIDAQEVGYIEAHASGIADEDSAEIMGLNRVYGATQPLSTAIGSVKANIGHTFNASGMASLIKTALCLYHRIIPATPNWSAPKMPEAWGESFYVPQDGRTWLSLSDRPRYAGVNGLGSDGTAAHLILSEGSHETSTPYLQHQPLKLFLIDADNKPGLIGRLGQMETALSDGTPFNILATRAFNVFRNRPYVLALVAKDRDGLRKEIEAAKKALPSLIDSKSDWQTPAGSYFTANPVGNKGSVAFVYPGAFNSYPGLGQDWMHLFPSALDYLSTVTSDPSTAVADTALYQRSLAAPSRAEVRAFRAKLGEDQVAMMESGTTFSVLYTHVMREVFKIQPAAAFGYSLGEGSMFWGMGVWSGADEATQRFHHSDLFTTRLFGRKEAVREMWGLPEEASNDFWNSYVVTASADVVASAMKNEAHVYLTHINTPNECVIAGDPAVCERVIERVGANSLKAPFEVVIHNEAMLSEFSEFYHLHRNPVSSDQTGIRFYSAADYLPVSLNTETIARNIARVTCKMVDFPRLVNRAYADGARVFIELGPGSTCSRWISDTLGEQEHISVSIDNLRSDDYTALIKMLARLASHRVPMDLSSLYAPLPEENAERKSILKTITLGGERVRDVILTEANRRKFSGTLQPVPERVPVSTAAPVMRQVSPPVQAAVSVEANRPAAPSSRLSGLRDIAASIRAQLRTPETFVSTTLPPVETQPVQPKLTPPTAITRFTPKPAVFDRDKIDQFARYRIADCFGEEYAIYDHKRAPRIPNTDLMFVSRAVEINATRLVTKPNSSMVMEYDVPADMWFYEDNSYPFTPYSVLMEMALQPCGFLSAYMGPTFDFPDIDFYFRNLDGVGHLMREVDLRGRTLTNRVELLSSTALQGMIIQKYSFDMQLDGESFYVGNSSFGYFTLQAFENQTGLDRGKPPTRWHEANPNVPKVMMAGGRSRKHQDDTYFTLPTGQLAFVDEAQITVNGGANGQGYVWATSKVSPSDWFFSCHFHQDPVMPGSLGLETITQAMQMYAIQANLGEGFKQPRFAHAEDHKMVWKYRGQVLSDSNSINVEVHITGVERRGERLVVTADASLWKGQIRLYEFKNVAIAIMEG
jgi:PfaB family protein